MAIDSIHGGNTQTGLIFGKEAKRADTSPTYVGVNKYVIPKDYVNDKNGIRVDISSEGLRALRDQVPKSNILDEVQASLDTLRQYASKNVVFSPGDGVSEDFHKRLLKMNSGLTDPKSEKGLTENCMAVYTAMYNEIKQGYADGTREKYILEGLASDPNAYRRLTEEEEIAALDKAFDFYSYVTAGYLTYGVQAGIDARNAMSRTRSQLESQNERIEEQQKKANLEKRFQDIYEKLKRMRDQVKQSYSS